MAPESMDLWRSAKTLDDLGRLTAAWLAGKIAEQPGYYGPVDVDEDDAPGLTDTLVALNRAGFVTNQSQAGFDGAGYDDANWQQLASVFGFADYLTLAWLRDVLRGTRFEVLARPCGRRFRRRLKGVPVTTREGWPYTVFGAQLTRFDIKTIYPGCHRAAIDALRDAWQVTIYDPQPGSNDLWPTLRRVAIEVMLP